MSGGTAEIRIRRDGMEADLGGLPPEKIRYLRVCSERKGADLDFLEAYPNVTQLFLRGKFASLDGVSRLAGLGSLTVYLSGPADFSGIQSAALKDLTVRCLAAGLSADKLSGTKIAEVLLRMEHLERANLRNLDRGGFRRYTVLENCLKKAGKERLLDASLDMAGWTLL